MAARLEVITGPMFAGKTEELIRRLRRGKIAQKIILLFKPSTDNRYDEKEVVSHNLMSWPSVPLPPDISAATFFSQFGSKIKKAQIIAFDEAQFFQKDQFLLIILKLLKKGKRVIISGLDLTFQGKPFGSMPELLSLADEVLKLTAICEVCGEPATKTQRLFKGKPLTSGPEVIIGGKEGEIRYIPVCNKHFLWFIEPG